MFFNKDDGKVKVNNAQITTFIGVDTKVEGTIITKSSVRIDGTVIGGVCSEGSVIVSKSGQIQGNIIADNIVIAGLVDGNMQIKDKTNIEPTGEVYGDISTDKILIDEESVFQGKVSMNKEKEADKKRRRIRVDESDEAYEALSAIKTVAAPANVVASTPTDKKPERRAEVSKDTEPVKSAEAASEVEPVKQDEVVIETESVKQDEAVKEIEVVKQAEETRNKALEIKETVEKPKAPAIKTPKPSKNTRKR